MNDTKDLGTEDVAFDIPPPPPPLNCLISNVVHSTKLLNDVEDDEAVSLEKAIKRVIDAERYFHRKPFYTANTYLKSQLQEGPKCGLVALSIATSKTVCYRSANELFLEAVKRGFTKQGEMYCAKNFANLIESTTAFRALVLESGIYSHLDCIFLCLQNGGLMLIPYDSDHNHSPCCKRGHSAHWAVITGLVIFTQDGTEGAETISDEDNSSLLTNPHLYPPCQCSESINYKFTTGLEQVNILRENCNIFLVRKGKDAVISASKCLIYLAAKQGKSKHLALWPFEALAESNNNLVELSEKHKTKDFVLSEGGVAQGLKGKAILLSLK